LSEQANLTLLSQHHIIVGCLLKGQLCFMPLETEFFSMFMKLNRMYILVFSQLLLHLRRSPEAILLVTLSNCLEVLV